MANSIIQVLPDGAGKKVQTFQNTVGANIVETQAIVQVDSNGAEVVTQPVSAASLPLPAGAATAANQQSNALTDAQLRATAVPVSGTVATGGLTDAQLRASLVDVDASGSAVSVSNFPATQPVSAVSLPLPAGAATAANQQTNALTDAQLRATAVPVSGTVTANAGTGTLAVSAASLPLPAGAATAAKQPAIGTAGTSSVDVLTVQGRAAMTPLLTDGSATTQPISGTVTSNVGTGTRPVSGTFWQATQPVSGTVTANAGTGTMAVSGPVTDAQLRASAVPVSLATAPTTPVTGTFWQATQPVSGTVTTTPPSNASTNVAQIVGAVPSATNPLPVRQSDGTGFIGTDIINSVRYLKTSIVQDIEVVAASSSTTNLAAGATFTGTTFSNLGVAAIQVCLFTDQNCTIQIQQAQEDPGTNWNIVDSWTYTANSTGQDAARTVQAMGSSFRVLVTNNGASSTTALRLQSVTAPVADTLPRGLTQLGNLRVALQEAVTVATKETQPATSTLSNVANSITNVTLLASNANRRQAMIFNDDSAANLFVKFGATASATSFTIKIAAGGYFELPQPIYTGIIDGIASAATGTTRVTELT